MIGRDPRWMYGSYGRKIETALEKKESGHPHPIKFVAGEEFRKQVTEYKNRT